MGRTLLVLVLALVGCKREPSPAATAPPAAVPAATGPAATGPAATGGVDLSGTVGETMSSGGYTYARIDRGATQTWIAGPETKLAVGAVLGKMDGTLMANFRSDTLKRTFDKIYFVTEFPAGTGTGAAAAVAANGEVAMAPSPSSAPAAPAGDDDLEGKILETMNSGGYTYAHLDHGGAKLWVAGPETKLAVGTSLGKMAGTLMTDFRSNTLNRTFDRIYFVGGFPGATAAPAATTAGSATVATAPAAPAVVDEKIAAAPNGKTVAAVWAAKDALKGKSVIVRGKVVKLNNGIMGRNWVHLRDGSGTNGTNDLLVTTQDVAKLGDVVTATGTIATKQDFGAGYAYDVMVENATLATK
ncbi:MAG: hypothetical protein ABI591_20175 [Kofleriaceae bacterium]